MRIEAYGHSDVGRVRHNNEDYFVVDPELGLYVVCDGMGGHAAGEVASHTAAEFVRRTVKERHESARDVDGASHIMRETLERANQAVFELAAAGNGRHGMGTTCTALWMRGPKGIMAHVGDSRLYMYRGGVLDQLTADHTYENEAIRSGLLSPEEAKASPFAGRVTRAIGVRDSVAVDTLIFDVLPGDTFLLCSDGLHQYEDSGSALTTRLAGTEVTEVARGLVEYANASGGRDNVTAVVVRVPKDAEPAVSAHTARVADRMNTLRHVFLFQELNMRERCQVMNVFQPMTVAAGDVVVTEGTGGDSLFVVVDGTLTVSRDEAALATLGRGSHFGEMALLSQRPRSATVRAETEVHLLELPRSAFLSLVAGEPTIGAKFLWKLAQALSLRLDDVYLMIPDAGRRTLELSGLSPFRGR